MSGLREYHPAHDPAFVDDVVNLLLDHKGEWLHPGRVVLAMRAATCEAIVLAEYTYRAVQVARNLGLMVEGDTQRGYRLTGYRRVRKVSPAWASRWPEVPVPARKHRRVGAPLGQLSVAEVVR